MSEIQDLKQGQDKLCPYCKQGLHEKCIYRKANGLCCCGGQPSNTTLAASASDDPKEEDLVGLFSGLA